MFNEDLLSVSDPCLRRLIEEPLRNDRSATLGRLRHRGTLFPRSSLHSICLYDPCLSQRDGSRTKIAISIWRANIHRLI